MSFHPKECARDTAMRYHYQIYDVIREGKAKKAGALVHEHVMETIERYSKLHTSSLRKRPVETSGQPL
jgi:DNA-binding FadR family transcriptional regulator